MCNLCIVTNITFFTSYVGLIFKLHKSKQTVHEKQNVCKPNKRGKRFMRASSEMKSRLTRACNKSGIQDYDC